jgi:hypothetical protein
MILLRDTTLDPALVEKLREFNIRQVGQLINWHLFGVCAWKVLSSNPPGIRRMSVKTGSRSHRICTTLAAIVWRIAAWPLTATNIGTPFGTVQKSPAG